LISFPSQDPSPQRESKEQPVIERVNLHSDDQAIERQVDAA